LEFAPLYTERLPLCLQNEQFPYCQSWVLGWQYRKQNLLKELLGYSADIVCLQEVWPQSVVCKMEAGT
jgi:mRNA deadenylase 3'-5' endonuclease subunit Ccr4